MEIPHPAARIKKLKEALKQATQRDEIRESFGGVRIKKWMREHLAQRTAEDWAGRDAWFPPDSLRIQIARDGENLNYVDLNRASPGQAARGGLAFQPQYGDEPLILDQPEDDLDNQMVFRMIVAQLRRIKKKRQVIIVTHNPNLVVSGNADLIFPLDTSGGPTRSETEGTPRLKELRVAGCRIMEGGHRVLEQRFRRIISSVE